MGRHILWLIILPLSLLGSEIAHAVGNLVLGSPAGSHGEYFVDRGPGSGLAPALSCGVALLVALGTSGRIFSVTPRRRSRWLTAAPFAVIGPLAFTVQEQLEMVGDGGSALGVLVTVTFMLGLGFQIPFALGSYVLARALIRVTDAIRSLCARMRTRAGTPPTTAPLGRGLAMRHRDDRNPVWVRGPPRWVVVG